MVRALIRGLLFGAAFGAAFLGVVVGAMLAFSGNSIEFRPASKIDVPPGAPQSVVPLEVVEDKAFKLYKGPAHKMEIPLGGGVLSIAVVDSPKNAKRPSTVQAWVTESNSYLIRTAEITPTVSSVPYPKSEPETYASKLVSDNAGFRQGNSTMTVPASDVEGLKQGVPSHQGEHLNGTLRVTSEGVVFFVPNEF